MVSAKDPAQVRESLLTISALALLAALLASAFLRFGPLAPQPAGAQGGANTRSWVSGTGDDAYPCSRTSPCKTFAGAIGKTAPGGEIDVLDPGAYGTVTITHSVTIDAGHNFAGVLNSGTNGIVVNAAAGDVVVLRGLTIDGHGTGVNGIRFIGAGKLFVDDVSINNESQNGIDFEPASSGNLFVNDSTIRNNKNAGQSGILINAGSAAIDGTRVENNNIGLSAKAGVNAAVDNSKFANNPTGLRAQAAVTSTSLAVSDSLVSDSSTVGLTSGGAASTILLSNTTIANNATGLSTTSGGLIKSFGNNPDSDSGAPTSTIPFK